MFRVLGTGNRRTCQGVSRRELLHVGSVGWLGLSLADLFQPKKKTLAEKWAAVERRDGLRVREARLAGVLEALA